MKSWGDKPYSKDMDFSLCRQSKPTDKYGTPKEIANAVFYYDTRLEDALFIDAIHMLEKLQQGIPDEKIKHLDIKKPKYKEVGDDQEIANKVHHTLDWMRACQKRTWDGRPMNSQRHILDYVMSGFTVNHATELHYDEDPERR